MVTIYIIKNVQYLHAYIPLEIDLTVNFKFTL